jgi:hypothetical protein
MKVSQKTLIDKVLQGVGESGCDIIIRDWSGKRATNNDIIKPLVEYLKRKGIEVK